MRNLYVTALLFTALLLLPGCKKKSDVTPPPDMPTTGEPEVVKEKKSVVICITREEADIREARVRAGKKQSVAWKAHDAAYTLRFTDAAWGFAEAPDRTETGYKLIDVPSGGMSNSYTLDYSLSPGETKEHHYQIEDTDPLTDPPPPNGPAIIGED